MRKLTAAAAAAALIGAGTIAPAHADEPAAFDRLLELSQEQTDIAAAEQAAQARADTVDRLFGEHTSETIRPRISGYFAQLHADVVAELETVTSQFETADPDNPGTTYDSLAVTLAGEDEHAHDHPAAETGADDAQQDDDVAAPDDVNVDGGSDEGDVVALPESSAGPGGTFEVAPPETDDDPPPTFSNDGIAPGTSLAMGQVGSCPIPGVRFINDWGYPRSGGRTHKGNDLFAPEGTPLFSMHDGVIRKVDRINSYRVGSNSGDLAGISLSYFEEDGDRWFFAHMLDIADGLQAGTPIKAGQLLGWVGRTGNAATTPPHAHTQYHPGSGAAVNPYPILAPVCLNDDGTPRTTPGPTLDGQPAGGDETASDEATAADEAADTQSEGAQDESAQGEGDPSGS